MDIPIMELFNMIGSCRQSTINFETSRGVEATGGEGVSGGLILQGIKLKDTGTGQSKWLDFGGAGVGMGVSPIPIGGSFSTENFPSFGSKVLKGTTSWGKLELSDLKGAGQIISRSYAAGPGAGGSLIFFNIIGGPTLFKAALWVEGLIVGLPGIGVMGYYGIWQ